MKRTVLFLLFSFCLFSGCSPNIRITGQVRFDDGEPVNFGEVCFETAQKTFLGRLDQNGNYAVGNTKDGTGIPPGEYTVYLSGTSLVSAKPGKGDSELIATVETVRVHPKYTQPGPGAFKFTVEEGGKKTLDLTVERPPQKGNSRR
ncbi:MAG: hypothetical protein LBQ54_07375 [Planctomycetaceae bacterium]|jgi:hypothetical protein|nr:hypothetical protein [Planctomycetaceae bacterium]